jgi:hypothetical protein
MTPIKLSRSFPYYVVASLIFSKAASAVYEFQFSSARCCFQPLSDGRLSPRDCAYRGAVGGGMYPSWGLWYASDRGRSMHGIPMAPNILRSPKIAL